MPKAQIFKVVGPPGTGKTHYILELIALATRKYLPSSIGAISFTNAAVREMRQRIVRESDAEDGAIRNVKTLHALSFDLLKMDAGTIADKKIKEFNEDCPEYALYQPNMFAEDEDMEYGNHLKENQKRFQRMQILRNQLVPEGQWPEDIREFYRTWTDWMDIKGYVDFTGLLERVHDIGRCPDIDVLFVDEAQDLTMLQLEIIKQWSLNIDTTTLVGDSDQAIFRFAGAQPEVFRDLKYHWNKVLSQSYRVPPAVHKFSMDILRQCKDREEIEYLPFMGNGEGRVISRGEPDLSLPGSHMIITRCNYRIPHWQGWLEGQGRIWHNPYRVEDKSWNPTETEEFQAIRDYLLMSKGHDLTVKEIKRLVKRMIAKGNLAKGAKKHIEEMELKDSEKVDIFSLDCLGFLPSFLSFKKPLDQVFKCKTKAGEIAQKLASEGDLNQEPVILGTIHSVKGGEADNVWIDRSETRAIKEQRLISEQARYDEVRVLYVAVTRSKQVVGML